MLLHYFVFLHILIWILSSVKLHTVYSIISAVTDSCNPNPNPLFSTSWYPAESARVRNRFLRIAPLLTIRGCRFSIRTNLMECHKLSCLMNLSKRMSAFCGPLNSKQWACHPTTNTRGGTSHFVALRLFIQTVVNVDSTLVRIETF